MPAELARLAELEAAAHRCLQTVDLLHNCRDDGQTSINETWLMRAGAFLDFFSQTIQASECAASAAEGAELYSALLVTPCFEAQASMLWPHKGQETLFSPPPGLMDPPAPPLWAPSSVLPPIPSLPSWFGSTAAAAASERAQNRVQSDLEETVLQQMGFVPEGLQPGSLSPPPLVSATSAADVVKGDLKTYIRNGATHQLQALLSQHSTDEVLHVYELLRSLLAGSAQLRRAFASSGCSSVLLECHSQQQQRLLMGSSSEGLVHAIGLSAGVLAGFFVSAEGSADFLALTGQPAATAIACFCTTLCGLKAIPVKDSYMGNQSLDGYAFTVAAYQAAGCFVDVRHLQSPSAAAACLPASVPLLKALHGWTASVHEQLSSLVSVEGGRRVVAAGRQSLQRDAARSALLALLLQQLALTAVHTGKLLSALHVGGELLGGSSQHHMVAWQQGIHLCSGMLGIGANHPSLHESLVEAGAMQYLAEISQHHSTTPCADGVAGALLSWSRACRGATGSPQPSALTLDVLWEAHIFQTLYQNAAQSSSRQLHNGVAAQASVGAAAGAPAHDPQLLKWDTELSTHQAATMMLALSIAAATMLHDETVDICGVACALRVVPYAWVQAESEANTPSPLTVRALASQAAAVPHLDAIMMLLQSQLRQFETPMESQGLLWPAGWTVQRSSAVHDEPLLRLASELSRDPHTSSKVMQFMHSVDSASFLFQQCLGLMATLSAGLAPTSVAAWIDVFPAHSQAQNASSLYRQAHKHVDADVCVLRVGELAHDWEVVSMRAVEGGTLPLCAQLLHASLAWATSNATQLQTCATVPVLFAYMHLSWVLAPAVAVPLGSSVACVLREHPSCLLALTQSQRLRVAQLTCFHLQRCAFMDASRASEAASLGLDLYEVQALAEDFSGSRSRPAFDEALLPFLSPEGNLAIECCDIGSAVCSSAASATPLATLCLLHRATLRSLVPPQDSQGPPTSFDHQGRLPDFRSISRPAAVFVRQFKAANTWPGGSCSPAVSDSGDSDSDASALSGNKQDTDTVLRSYRWLGFKPAGVIELQFAGVQILSAWLTSPGHGRNRSQDALREQQLGTLRCVSRQLIQLCGHANVEICKTALSVLVAICEGRGPGSWSLGPPRSWWLTCAGDIALAVSSIDSRWGQEAASKQPHSSLAELFSQTNDAFGIACSPSGMQAMRSSASSPHAKFWPRLSSTHVFPHEELHDKSLAVVFQFGVLPVLSGLLAVPHASIQSLAMQGIAACCGMAPSAAATQVKSSRRKTVYGATRNWFTLPRFRNACLFACRVCPGELCRLVAAQGTPAAAAATKRSPVNGILTHLQRFLEASLMVCFNASPPGGPPRTVSLVEWTNPKNAALVSPFCEWLYETLSPGKFTAWTQATVSPVDPRPNPPAGNTAGAGAGAGAAAFGAGAASPTAVSPLSFITSLWQPAKLQHTDRQDAAFHLSCLDAVELLRDVRLRAALAWDSKGTFPEKAEATLAQAHHIPALIGGIKQMLSAQSVLQGPSQPASALAVWCWHTACGQSAPLPAALGATQTGTGQLPPASLCVSSSVETSAFCALLQELLPAAHTGAQVCFLALHCCLLRALSERAASAQSMQLIEAILSTPHHAAVDSGLVFQFLAAVGNGASEGGLYLMLGQAREVAVTLALRVRGQAAGTETQAYQVLQAAAAMLLHRCEVDVLLSSEADGACMQQLHGTSHLFMSTVNRFFLRRMAASQLMQRKIVHFAGLVEGAPRFVSLEMPRSTFQVHALRTALGSTIGNPAGGRSATALGMWVDCLVHGVQSGYSGFGLSWVDPPPALNEDLLHSLPSLLQDGRVACCLQSFEMVNSKGHTAPVVHAHRRLHSRLQSAELDLGAAGVPAVGRDRTGSDFQTQSSEQPAATLAAAMRPRQHAKVRDEQVQQLLGMLPLSVSWLTLDGCCSATGLATVLQAASCARSQVLEMFAGILAGCLTRFDFAAESAITQGEIADVAAAAEAVLKPHFKAQLHGPGSFSGITSLCLRNLALTPGDVLQLCSFLKGERRTVPCAVALAPVGAASGDWEQPLQLLEGIWTAPSNDSRSLPILMELGLVDPFQEQADSPWSALAARCPGGECSMPPQPTLLNASKAFSVSPVGLPSCVRDARVSASFHIVHLDMSGCLLGDRQAAAVTRAVASAGAIQTLDLSRNCIGDGTQFLIELRWLLSSCSNLKALHIAYNDLSSSFVESLLDMYTQLKLPSGMNFLTAQAQLPARAPSASLSVLDLAANALGGERLQGRLARFVRDMTSLRELDVSNNLMTPSFVLLLLQLSSQGSISHLWAVHLSGNSALSSGPMVQLLKALRGNRLKFNSESLRGRQGDMGESVTELGGAATSRLPALVPSLLRPAATARPQHGTVHSAQQESASLDLASPIPPSPNTLDLRGEHSPGGHGVRHLSVLYASPLQLANGAQAAALPRLHFESERVSIFNGLLQAGRAIVWENCFMSVDKLQRSLHAGSQVLHLSCHSNSNRLALEGDHGHAQTLEAANFDEILSVFSAPGAEAAAQSLPFLAVCSSCSSQWIGEAFLRAGVRCTVCIKLGQDVSDDSAAMFSSAFYAALASGWPVAAAFAAGQQRLRLGRAGRNQVDADKYVLLGDIQQTRCCVWEHVPRLAGGVRFTGFCADSAIPAGSGVLGGQWDDNGPSFFPLLHDIPAQPRSFIGYSAEICRCLELLARSRLCVLQGARGCGKSAVAGQVAQYTALRQLASGGVHFFDMGCFSLHKAQLLGALGSKLLRRRLEFTDFHDGSPQDPDSLWVASADSVNLNRRWGSKKRSFKGLRLASAQSPSPAGPLFVTASGALGVLCGELNDTNALLVMDNVTANLLPGALEICDAFMSACPQLQVLLTLQGAQAAPDGRHGNTVQLDCLTLGDAAVLLGRAIGSRVMKQQRLSREDAMHHAACCGCLPGALLAQAESILRDAMRAGQAKSDPTS